jgi:hypothetical protein
MACSWLGLPSLLPFAMDIVVRWSLSYSSAKLLACGFARLPRLTLHSASLLTNSTWRELGPRLVNGCWLLGARSSLNTNQATSPSTAGLCAAGAESCPRCPGNPLPWPICSAIAYHVFLADRGGLAAAAAILLMYDCYLRPYELLGLRFRDVIAPSEVLAHRCIRVCPREELRPSKTGIF